MGKLSTRRAEYISWSSIARMRRCKRPVAGWASIVGGRAEARRYHHYWRDDRAVWHHVELPGVAGNRPKLFIDQGDNAYLIFSDTRSSRDLDPSRGNLKIMAATPEQHWKDWKVIHVERGPFGNEMLGDYYRWQQEGILSVIVQGLPKNRIKPRVSASWISWRTEVHGHDRPHPSLRDRGALRLLRADHFDPDRLRQFDGDYDGVVVFTMIANPQQAFLAVTADKQQPENSIPVLFDLPPAQGGTALAVRTDLKNLAALSVHAYDRDRFFLPLLDRAFNHPVLDLPTVRDLQGLPLRVCVDPRSDNPVPFGFTKDVDKLLGGLGSRGASIITPATTMKQIARFVRLMISLLLIVE